MMQLNLVELNASIQNYALILANSTGKESVYTVFAGHEIMFHVSTLLPYSKENEQQVIIALIEYLITLIICLINYINYYLVQIERKRHVGNDIVNIVFESSNDPLHPSFSPTMMKSHFTRKVLLENMYTLLPNQE